MNHKIKNVAIGTFGGVVDTDQGKVIAILHEHAILGKGQTIHSSGQMEHHRNVVRARLLNNPKLRLGCRYFVLNYSAICQKNSFSNHLMHEFCKHFWKTFAEKKTGF